MDTERRFAVGLIVLAGLLILYGVLFREQRGGGRPREFAKAAGGLTFLFVCWWLGGLTGLVLVPVVTVASLALLMAVVNSLAQPSTQEPGCGADEAAEEDEGEEGEGPRPERRQRQHEVIPAPTVVPSPSVRAEKVTREAVQLPDGTIMYREVVVRFYHHRAGQTPPPGEVPTPFKPPESPRPPLFPSRKTRPAHCYRRKGALDGRWHPEGPRRS
jgi:hypothetical protein